MAHRVWVVVHGICRKRQVRRKTLWRIPAEFRCVCNQRQRARDHAVMQRAKYDDRWYDRFDRRRRTVRWEYW
jgi:hypothetical protein